VRYSYYNRGSIIRTIKERRRKIQMKKKWFGMVSALMVLAVLFTGLPAMAQTEAEETTEIETACPALGIRAPRVAPVGREVTIGVFERGTSEPVEGVFVFALSRDNAEAFKAEMAVLSEDNTVAAADKDYKALADVYGELLDITDENGEIHYAFDEAGWYLLVAVKGGYYPGFAPIAIRPAVKALGIRAPQVALVGEEVTITVFDRVTQEPAEGAFVFVLSPGAAEALKEEMAVFRGDSTVDATDIDYESLVSMYGELIDITDENGEVQYTFETAGRYLLVAVKPHYLPGFAHITIRPAVDALGIKAPDMAPVGEEVTITVFKRGTGEPVEGAFVFALSRENAEALKAEIAALGEDVSTAPADIDYMALAEVYGELLDITDENGEVHHAFDEAGRYLLLAVKPDYLPAFRPIRIGAVPTALVIRAPKAAPVGEEVTIGVYERGTGEPVEGAGVWVLSRDNAVALNEEISSLKEETVSVADIDYKALVSVHGELIDYTDENGEVHYAFDEAGWYLLVAVKPGCLPGFAPIRIGTPPKILGIRAPRIARTGNEVTIGVFERKTQSPVEGAGVWVVSREKIGALKAEIAKLKEGVRTAENDVDFEPLVSIYGEFIDWTDENGEVRYTFEEPGLYLLVAVKKGCYPGFSPILIRSLSVDSSGNALQTNALTSAQVQQTRVISNQVQLKNKPEITETE
jgi:Ca2+-binding EF-hand superfamily protein